MIIGSGMLALPVVDAFPARISVLVLAFAPLLGGCATTETQQVPLRISKITQGLARVDSQDKGHIYSEGTTFRYAPNGQCVEAGNTVPCMWFAVAFEYQAASEVTNLSCTMKFTEPVREFSAPFTLRGKTGKVFWPGYVTEGSAEPVRTTTVCMLEGKEVLKVDFAFD